MKKVSWRRSTVAKGTLDIEEGVPEETLQELEAIDYKLGKSSGSRPVVLLNKARPHSPGRRRELHFGVTGW